MVDRPGRQVGIKITGSHPVPPAEGANFFHFTAVGGEIQLLVGTVNLLRVHEATLSEPPPSVTPDITHRFLMSPLGFAHLKRQLDEIAPSVLAAMESDGPEASQ